VDDVDEKGGDFLLDFGVLGKLVVNGNEFGSHDFSKDLESKGNIIDEDVVH
jgi:hypothetical protein